jgi:HK97 family phage portal protein
VDILRRPNKNMPGYRFRYGLSAYLSLTGDVFIEKDDPVQPHHLWLLKPSLMDIQKDAKRKVGGYEYDVNGATVYYEPEEIIHIDTFNPTSEYFGLSTVSPLTSTLTIDFYVQAFEKAFFRNGGHVGLHFSTDKDLDKNVWERLRAAITQAISGTGKNHKVLFTGSGVKMDKIAVDPKEADLTALRNYNIREILAAVGVPRMLIMDSEETAYANAEAQQRVFWEQSIMPHNQSIQDYLNLGIYYPNDMECEVDYSGVAVLQENRKAIIDLGVAAVNARILTVNEIREEYLKKKPVPWGDVPPEPARPQGMGTDYGVPLYMSADRAAITKRNEETLASLRDQWESRFFKILKAYFKGQQDIFEQNVAAYKEKHPVQKADIAHMLTASLTKKESALIDQILKLSNDMGRDFYGANYRKYSDGKKPPAWLAPSREDFIKKSVKEFAEEIDKTTLDSLRDHIDKGLEAGETVDQIKDRVQDVFDQTTRAEDSRAFMIARTETAKVENYAALQSFDDLGAKYKIWVAGGPPGDRPGHTAMDGEKVEVDKEFSNGLRFPGDPNGEPGEIINCRCTVAPGFD